MLKIYRHYKKERMILQESRSIMQQTNSTANIIYQVERKEETWKDGN
jgi:hypothetical protein